MMLRILTILAFSLFLFVIYQVGTVTPLGFLIKQVISSVPFFDKLIHMCLLTILSFLLNASIGQRKVNLYGLDLLLGSLLVAIGITLEECSQAFIPSRNFELMDMVCNYAGIYVGGFLLCLLDLKNTNDANNHSDKTILLQAFHNRTRQVRHEGGNRWRLARGLGQR